jgi:hypothetical protein
VRHGYLYRQLRCHASSGRPSNRARGRRSEHRRLRHDARRLRCVFPARIDVIGRTCGMHSVLRGDVRSSSHLVHVPEAAANAAAPEPHVGSWRRTAEFLSEVTGARGSSPPCKLGAISTDLPATPGRPRSGASLHRVPFRIVSSTPPRPAGAPAPRRGTPASQRSVARLRAMSDIRTGRTESGAH